jgi:AraC-like DNA-binding protein
VSGHGSPAHDARQNAHQVICALLGNGSGHPSVQLVADRMGTSVRTLQRRLQATGATYAALVQEARCTAAREMLKEGRQRIADVARALGYSDPAHFTRAFRRSTGLTPRDFRRRG